MVGQQLRSRILATVTSIAVGGTVGGGVGLPKGRGSVAGIPLRIISNGVRFTTGDVALGSDLGCKRVFDLKPSGGQL
jgi:hypothetical protein